MKCTTLRPCPFCGGECNVVTWPMGHMTKEGWEYWMARPYCGVCVAEHLCYRAGTQHDARRFAVAGWNHRPKAKKRKAVKS
jgi:hypothetical protein